MKHPSSRTLVRVLRLDGAKRRIILAAAKHNCGACDAQKRPACPIVSRSPTCRTSPVFLKHVRRAQPIRHEHRVLGQWIAAFCSSSRRATQLVFWHICGEK